MSGSDDGWDDDGGWDDEDDLSWDEDDDIADLGDDDEAGEAPAPRRRKLVAPPIAIGDPDEPIDLDQPTGYLAPTAYGSRYDDDEDDRDRYEEERIRSSRLWVVAAGLLLLIGAGVALALVLSSDDDGGESAADVDTAASSTTSSTLSLALPGDVGSSTSTSLGGTSTSAVGGAGGAGSTTSTMKKPTSTTSTVPPEDTNDPACSQAGVTPNATSSNKPARISFCVDDASPKVGQAITINGTAVDEDSQIEPGCIVVFYDSDPPPTCTPGASPPEPVINREFSATHAFTTPGPHTIHVSVASDTPNQSLATTLLKVTVHA
jgi:hypothetical protein